MSSFTERLDGRYDAMAQLKPKHDSSREITGQQLVISWSLPSKLRSKLPMVLEAKIRHDNGFVITKSYPVSAASGIKIYLVEGNELKEKGGVSSYNLVLKSQDRVISVRKHHLWTEVIMLSDFEK